MYMYINSTCIVVIKFKVFVAVLATDVLVFGERGGRWVGVGGQEGRPLVDHVLAALGSDPPQLSQQQRLRRLANLTMSQNIQLSLLFLGVLLHYCTMLNMYAYCIYMF